jgi:serine/threonine protein phosphatase 1
MMLSVDFGVMKAADWIMNGGDKTRESYTSHDQWKSHVAWMYGLELAVRDNHRAYVHAMLPEKYVWGDPLSETAIWGRVRGDVGAGDLHMVHGHTPAPNLELLTKRTNLDGGAVFTGRLAVGVFDDDLPGGPIEILWAMEAK